MRITPLASGSQGNSVLIETPTRRVLVDAGLRVDVLEQRLEDVGMRPSRITDLLLTHRHRDHIHGATDFCKKHKVRIHAPRRTARRLGSECHRLIRYLQPESPVEFDDLHVLPIPVPHDAPDTVAYLFEREGRRHGHATDLGNAHGVVRSLFHNCDSLFIEFNYDAEMLASGPYPPALRRRIVCGTGHLSNAEAADWLSEIAHPGLSHVWVAHVSQKNNLPELALSAARTALGDCGAALAFASQDMPSQSVDLTVAGFASGKNEGVAWGSKP